jgi:hypothetical protein
MRLSDNRATMKIMLSTPEMMTASRLALDPRYIHLDNVQSSVSSSFRIGASVQGRGYTGYLGWVSMNNLQGSPIPSLFLQG